MSSSSWMWRLQQRAWARSSKPTTAVTFIMYLLRREARSVDILNGASLPSVASLMVADELMINQVGSGLGFEEGTSGSAASCTCRARGDVVHQCEPTFFMHLWAARNREQFQGEAIRMHDFEDHDEVGVFHELGCRRRSSCCSM